MLYVYPLSLTASPWHSLSPSPHPSILAPTLSHSQGKADVLRVVCGDGSVLGITELQPPGKKVQAARDFLNGLRGQYAIRWTVPPAPTPEAKEVGAGSTASAAAAAPA